MLSTFYIDLLFLRAGDCERAPVWPLIVVHSCLKATFPQAAFIVQAAFFSEKVDRWLFWSSILLNVMFILYTYKAALFQDPVQFEVIFLKEELLPCLW